MSTELQVLQDEIAALKTHNNEVMAIVNSDTPLTHKIKTMLDQPKIRAEFLALLPDVANREQILRAEIQSILFDIMQSSELQQCTPQSFLFCLKDSLARGLRIGSAHKEAWLIKFNNKKKDANGLDVYVNEAKIMVGYRAYINKAWNENKIRFVVGTVTLDEVQYVAFDRSQGKLEINIPLGKETKLHTKENIEYVYVTSIAEDGSKWSDLYTKEAIEEKSKTGKWENKKKVYGLGKVWGSEDRVTDYKEMLHKGAIILFNKMQPSRGLNELADFDHRQLEAMQDITPATTGLPALSAPTSAINDILSGKSLDEQFSSEQPLKDHLNASIDAALAVREASGDNSSPDEPASLSDRVYSMIAEIHMDRECVGTADYADIANSEGFKAIWAEVKKSGDKELLGAISGALA